MLYRNQERTLERSRVKEEDTYSSYLSHCSFWDSLSSFSVGIRGGREGGMVTLQDEVFLGEFKF